MSLLVRKISKPKWHQDAIEGQSPVSADAITCDLRTDKNCLSVWRVSDITRLDEVVLALASQHQKLDTIDVAALDEQTILESGLKVEQKAAPTPVEELQSWHRDIVSLDYDSLGEVAQIIACSFRLDRVKRYSALMIAKIIVGAVSNGRLDPQKLDQEFFAKAKSKLAAA